MGRVGLLQSVIIHQIGPEREKDDEGQRFFFLKKEEEMQDEREKR